MVWKVQRKRAGAHVVGANVPGRRRQALADAAADDQQILVDDAGRGQPNGLRLGGSAQIVAQVHAAVAAEARDRRARARVERVQVLILGRRRCARRRRTRQ